jgi:hypothetical protein
MSCARSAKMSFRKLVLEHKSDFEFLEKKVIGSDCMKYGIPKEVSVTIKGQTFVCIIW